MAAYHVVNVPSTEGAWLVALRNGRARTHQMNASMADLAVILSSQLSHPVTDATGLTGQYDFTLSWMNGVSTDTTDAGRISQQLSASNSGSSSKPRKLPLRRW